MTMQRRTGLVRVPLAPRTVPLRRTSDLEPSAGPERGEPIRPPRTQTGFSRAVKLQCRQRAARGVSPDVALCEACGVWLGAYGGEVRYRLPRGMGDCGDEVTCGPANAVLLCGSPALGAGCSGAAELRDPWMGPDAGGFWLRYGTGPEGDPRYAPIRLAGEGGREIRVWLSPDKAEYLTESPEGPVV